MANEKYVDEVQVRGQSFDISDKILRQIIAPIEETDIVSKDYNIGDHLIYKNKLYKTTQSILKGSTLSINGNIVVETNIVKLLDNKADIVYNPTEESLDITNSHLTIDNT